MFHCTCRAVRRVAWSSLSWLQRLHEVYPSFAQDGCQLVPNGNALVRFLFSAVATLAHVISIATSVKSNGAYYNTRCKLSQTSHCMLSRAHEHTAHLDSSIFVRIFLTCCYRLNSLCRLLHCNNLSVIAMRHDAAMLSTLC